MHVVDRESATLGPARQNAVKSRIPCVLTQ